MKSQCLCHSLRKATRRVTAIYDEALAPAGVNLAQFSLLRNIARHAPLSLTELGRRVELDRSTIGRNVRVLEKMGLTAPSALEDQREAGVKLTPMGQETLERGVPYWEAAQARLEHTLGAADFDRLNELLDTV